MTIIRTSHDKERPYVILNKKALEDPNLSWEAKGLWSYLMSRPDNWQVSVTHLMKTFGTGRDKIYKILKELIGVGYCIRNRRTDAENRFLPYEYVILEQRELKKCLPHTDFPYPGKTDANNTNVFPPISIPKNKKDNVKEKPKEPPPKPKPQKKTVPFSKKGGETVDLAKKFKLTPEQEETFKWLKGKQLNTEDSTLCYWAKTYSVLRLNSVITQAFKAKRTNVGGYINTILKKNSPIHDENIHKNTEFAKDFKKAHHWFELEIDKKCIKIGTMWDLSLNIDPIDFANHLMYQYEKRHT